MDGVTQPSDPQEPGPSSDRIPPDALAAAKAAFTSRTEGEVAQLAFDSLLDGTGSPENHVLRFEHDSVTIHVRIVSTNDDFTLSGRVQDDPPPVVALHLHAGGDPLAYEPREGAFEFVHVPHGQARLGLNYGPEKPVIWTDWFLL